MIESLPLVAYSFAYVRRQIRSLDDLNANGALKRQRAAQLGFEKRSGRQVLENFADWSTYRGASFVARHKFHRAISVARNVGADLLLADIGDLIEHTRPDQIVRCFGVLNSLDIEVWDASQDRTWQSMTPDEQRSLISGAARTMASRSKAVRQGISLSSAKKGAPPKGNHQLGNLANRRSADQCARRHQDFVLREMDKLLAGQELSPSALAAALNAAGVSSARGGQWTHNTAKDLIARIGKLPAKPTST
ncbi:hypothetical protein LB566_25065 [Mesorhizobium sp. CA13]|uniref:hypothetical protein n=1 Tax=Mesorhizobium sp. CA13 TaxID=2876643 RepID=UPI001CCD1143|nr:hypothetical protein [Mesorhizobium sp. CA13]MBZ9857067.1 hypothetical protein [Mesorhizobium sp. CA13]